MFGAADAKIVRFIRRHSTAHPQEPANLVFSSVLHTRISHHQKHMFIVLRIVLAISLVGDEDLIVAPSGRRVFLFLKDANHGVQISIHQQLFAQ